MNNQVRYIAIDGPDGCGKTTLINRLRQDFPEYIYIREPGDANIPDNQKIRKRLLSEEVSILEQAFLMHNDRSNLLPFVKEQKEQNNTVISDRCIASTLVYQRNFALNIDFLMQLHASNGYLFDFLNCIDAIIILDIDEKIRQERIGTRTELDLIEQKGEDYFKNILYFYKSLKEDLSTLGYNNLAKKIHYINANQTQDALYKDFVARFLYK